MEQHVDHMEPTGVHVEQLRVQKIGEPGERMPVREVKPERPRQSRGRESRFHDWVVVDERIVVIHDEAVVERPEVNGNCGEDEECAQRRLEPGQVLPHRRLDALRGDGRLAIPVLGLARSLDRLRKGCLSSHGKSLASTIVVKRHPDHDFVRRRTGGPIPP